MNIELKILLIERIRLAKADESISQERSKTQKPRPEVPLPKIKRKFTQRDKDLFLREAFNTVKQYFQNALSELERHYQGIQTDFAEVHNFKFTCTIYLHGDVSNRCKIWVGGPHSTHSIAYHEGDSSFDNDNSYNDWLDVTDEGSDLGLKPAGFGFGGPAVKKDKALSPEKGAEYLWLRFIEYLKH